MASNNSIKVCVTGASGYIATHIVKQLLEKGYFVVGTVRDPADEAKTSTLRKIAHDAGAEERLELVKADLLDDGSFDEAVKGCNHVLHTASPFFINKKGNPYDIFINPAVKGVENVLGACRKAESVKTVVITSSVAAIYGHNTDKTEPFSEADWNTSSTVEDDAYFVSKTRAEKAAWDLSKNQSNFKLVAINPGFVFGPTLTGRNDTASINFMKDLVDGKMRMGAPDMSMGLVDVRDVAEAHIKAFEIKEAEGRFICVAESMSFMNMADLLRPKYGQKYSLPSMTVPKWMVWLIGPLIGMSRTSVTHNVGVPIAFDNSKIKSQLGINFRPISESLDETVQSMIETGLLRKK